MDTSRSTVDHICLPGSVRASCRLKVWECERLSDHNGVMVTIVQDSLLDGISALI